jgi:hypothetical protein
MGASGCARYSRARGQKQVLEYRLPFASGVRNTFSAKVFCREVFDRLPVKISHGEARTRIANLWGKTRRNAVNSEIEAVRTADRALLPLTLLSF